MFVLLCVENKSYGGARAPRIRRPLGEHEGGGGGLGGIGRWGEGSLSEALPQRICFPMRMGYGVVLA